VAYADPVVGWSLRYFLQNPMYLVMGVMVRGQQLRAFSRGF
jgi:hypothetical protein